MLAVQSLAAPLSISETIHRCNKCNIKSSDDDSSMTNFSDESVAESLETSEELDMAKLLSFDRLKIDSTDIHILDEIPAKSHKQDHPEEVQKLLNKMSEDFANANWFFREIKIN